MASTIAVGKQFIIVPSYALSLQRKYFYQVLATYQRTKRRGRSHLNRKPETELVRRRTRGKQVGLAAGRVSEARLDKVRKLSTVPETIGPEEFDR